MIGLIPECPVGHGLGRAAEVGDGDIFLKRAVGWAVEDEGDFYLRRGRGCGGSSWRASRPWYGCRSHGRLGWYRGWGKCWGWGWIENDGQVGRDGWGKLPVNGRTGEVCPKQKDPDEYNSDNGQ